MLRKFLTLIFIVVTLALPFSCANLYYSNHEQTVPGMPSKEKLQGMFGTGKVSLDDIEDAEKLQDKYPDDAFIAEHSYVVIDSNKKAVKKKKKSDDDDESDDDDDEGSAKKKKEKAKKKKYEDSLMVSPVSANVYNETRLVSLVDNVSTNKYIGYSEFETVTGIKLAYGGSDLEWFNPTVSDMSYSGQGIFYSDARLKNLRIDAPILGTKVNYKYNQGYKNIKFLTSVYFTEQYFQKEKTIVFKVPDWLDIEIIEKNFEGYDIKKTDIVPKYMKSKIKGGVSSKKSSDDDGDKDDSEEEDEEKPVKKSNGSVKKKKKAKKSDDNAKDSYKYIVYTATNVKARKYEKGAPGSTHDQPHIVIVCKSYKNEKNDTIPMMRDVSDLYAWYKSLVNTMENDTAALKKFTTKLVEGQTTDMAKVEKVFYWVQDNIRYIAFEDGIAGFKPDACQNVFKNRYGDCKGMANLIANMLKSIGYDARLTWIGTRHIAYDYTIPSVAVDNHMICTLILNGKRYFLDGTEKFIAIGDYGHRIQGQQVLIENGDSYFIDSIPDLGYQRNRELKTSSLTIDGNQLKGKSSLALKGESKVMIMNILHETKSDRKSTLIDRYLSDANVNVKVKNAKHNDLQDRKKDVIFNFDYTVNNQVIKNGNDIYVNPDYEKDYYFFYFDSTRTSAYDFSTNIFEEETDTVETPAGFKVKRLPPPVLEETPWYLISLNYTQSGSKVIYNKKIIFKQGVIPFTEIKKWNEVNKKMRVFYDDFILYTR